jgi:hypothetical protein
VGTRRVVLSFVAVALLVGSGLDATAEEVQRKWRVSLAAGGYNAQDEVPSAAGNELLVVDSCIQTASCPPGFDAFVALYRDPRSDSASFGNLDFNAATLGTVAVQYGVGKRLLVEGSIGFRRGNVGDVEISAEFFGNGPEDPEILPFNFLSYRVPAGELTQVPIQLSALARLRPRARFNPYLGGGIGYAITGFKTDPAFDQLSVQMDATKGLHTRLTSSLASIPDMSIDDPTKQDIQGATVDARDSFEWHLAGGFELSFKSKWAAFLDLRWIDASRSLSIGFDGKQELGVSVPNYVAFSTSPLATIAYGGVQIGSCGLPTATTPACTSEGLLDVGQVQVVPAEGAPFGTNCDPANGGDPNQPVCVTKFIFTPDGRPDPGIYYVKGGTMSYDGFALQVGIRYTFGRKK